MDQVELEYKNLVPLFLGITIQNCKATIPETTKALNEIFKGWDRLLKIRHIKAPIKGWFRALELTYNKARDEFHLHIHAIILVDESYFKTSAYMKTAEWVQRWRSSMRLDYDPICDIRKIKNDKGKRKGIAEVAKYTVKDTDFITPEKPLTDRLTNILNKTLKKRRLVAYGGIMRQIATKFREFEDLVNTGEGTIREDVATVIEKFSWRFGLADYVLMRPSPQSNLASLAAKEN
jgi:hypothetical protein